MSEASRINNTTIAKLDRNEISVLGLYSNGIYTYKGTLKARKQGYKTVKMSDFQTNFVGERNTIEFIKIVSLGDEPEYAMRIKVHDDGDKYIEQYPILWGCDFFK